MDSYNLFSREIKNLRRWYYGTIYSYNISSKFINDNYRKEEKKGNRTPVYYNNIEEQEYLIQQSHLTLKAMYQKKYPSYIKDLIVIRVISALEVFLVDSIAEVFVVNKNPFITKKNSDKVIELRESEILAKDSLSYIYSKIINDISSNLHRQGFKEISKYYNNILKINFNNFRYKINDMEYGKERIERLHDVRHVLVHRLGVTDSVYRNKFNEDNKKIHISEEELLNMFKYILGFAKYVNDNLEILYFNDQNIYKEKKDYIENNIIVEKPYDSINKYIDLKFNFIVDGQVCIVKDILNSFRYGKNYEIILNISGDDIIINKYTSILKRQCKKNSINIKVQKIRRVFKKNDISKDEIDKVKANLPKERPWEKNIHKRIAEKLGMSNTRVSKIIDLIFNKENY
ncbi:hypothetical protein [Clostridium beijerinckii]|uniref:hypothetical protein n=1 Tax=Clostridium beijerinckii TaxID=1520 RepID=UPI0024321680|nr:hypothetical protein [Clostridium beijerinckii]MDG5854384.1 hypothetical protein [Clostridium beijerinckii]